LDAVDFDARPDGFVYNILTAQDVVDKSVSGLYERICLRFVVDVSVGGRPDTDLSGCGVSGQILDISAKWSRLYVCMTDPVSSTYTLCLQTIFISNTVNL